MKFDERFIPAIREGRKTQTRRPVKASNSEVWSRHERVGFPESLDGFKASVGVLTRYGCDILPAVEVDDEIRIAPDLTIRITAVHVERLQETSKADVVAEGFPECLGVTVGDPFAEAWDSLYPDPPHNWGSDPWVWVYEFEVCDG